VSGKPHRVISEEDGLVLLDMIVCADCAEQAQKLRLKTEELEYPEQRQHDNIPLPGPSLEWRLDRPVACYNPDQMVR